MADPFRSLTLLGMTWRNLYRQPLRSSLTILGVSVGVIAVVALGTLVRGLWSTADDAIHSGGIDLVVYQKGVSWDVLSRLDEAETRAALSRIPEIADATAGIMHYIPIADRPFVILLGIHPNELTTRDLSLLDGRVFASLDEVLIGAILARELELSVGDTIELQGTDFNITGVFSTDVIFFNGAVMLPLKSLQQLVGMVGEIGYCRVRLREGADPVAVAERIERENPNLTTIRNVHEYKKIDLSLEIADDVVFLITFVATIIGAIIVMNTMWMSVYERTREIGVLRAVGWSSRRIMGMIIVESAGIALIACGVGSLLGVGLAKFAASLPIARQFASPVFTASTFLLAISMAAILGIVGGLLPAWRAARISPAEALRYE